MMVLSNIGLGELLLILIVVLLLFGPDRLPKLAKAIGESVREFKRAMYSEPEKKRSKKKKPSG